MTLTRTVLPETLDALDPDNPAARRSRRDLVRVHLAMGTRGLLARALAVPPALPEGCSRLEVLELGAGDGTLMLAVAGRIADAWPPVRLTLLDRVDIVSPDTRDAYAALGWEVETLGIDVLEWATSTASMSAPASGPGAGAGAGAYRPDLICTSLFLHHFEGDALDALLHGVAARTDRFVAFEPRRDRLSLLGSHLVGLLGANAVTREDAVTSVHAGFRGGELSARWPDPAWRLDEGAAGAFGHRLDARRRSAA